ncbi:MAG: hypothetical protein OER21_03875 [Gemmatimonadota bacterium]|nr:hypothetical protein [Gemmatimonadota bacterium]
MRRGLRPPAAGAVALALLAIAAGCAEDRLRPGPPTLTIAPPPGNVVTSPDTALIIVLARDDNGLDSVTVTILGRTEEIDAFDRIEAEGVFLWPIPAGFVPGQVIEIAAFAKDLVGDRTTATASVTVVAPPALGLGRRP